MSFSDSIYPAIYSLPLGMLIFSIIYYISRLSIKLYLQYYINKLEKELSNIFLAKQKKIIISYHILFILLIGILGYLIAEFIGLIFAFYLAYIIPIKLLYKMKQKHINKFIHQLPDVMHSLSAMLKAGTHLSKAMHLVAEQHAAPVSQEFMIVLSEYKMGRNLNLALEDMSKRINRQEVELLVSAITISSHVGGNLASTLDILAETLREKITIEGKIDALTAMGRMQGRVVTFIPVAVLCMLYLQEPEAMLLLFIEPIGWMTMLILITLMITASIIIKKITKINI